VIGSEERLEKFWKSEGRSFQRRGAAWNMVQLENLR